MEPSDQKQCIKHWTLCNEGELSRQKQNKVARDWPCVAVPTADCRPSTCCVPKTAGKKTMPNNAIYSSPLVPSEISNYAATCRAPESFVWTLCLGSSCSGSCYKSLLSPEKVVADQPLIAA